MKLHRTRALAWAGMCLALAGIFAPPIAAQQREAVVPPPKQFASAEEHYNFLRARANGGTKHTVNTLPDWSGIWQSGISTMSMRHPVDAPLSPAYRANYAEKQRQEKEIGEVYYDRLTHCEPSAYPRWIVEPYHKEFSLSPNQSWLMQEFMNETRRVYTNGRPHSTPEGNTWLGDSIGFWDADKLVIWTTSVKAADYLRGYPDNSAALEGIEVWQRVKGAVSGGTAQPDRIVVQATMYDPVGLTRPWNVATSYVKADYEHRIRYWDCALTSNDVQSSDGKTTSILPGEKGYKPPKNEVTRSPETAK